MFESLRMSIEDGEKCAQLPANLSLNPFKLTAPKVEAIKIKRSHPSREAYKAYLQMSSWHPLEHPSFLVEREEICAQIPEREEGKLHEWGSDYESKR